MGNSFELNEVHETQIELFQIDHRVCAVVDNLYRDPLAVQQIGLQLWRAGQNKLQLGRYPGRHASAEQSSAYLVRFLNEHVVEGGGLAAWTGNAGLFEKVVFGVITDSHQTVTAHSAVPHIDDFCDYNCLVYLSSPAEGHGGTNFWRSKRGHSCVGPLPRERGREIIETWPHAGYLLDDDENWERVHTVDLVFNRLLLFPSRLYHSALVPRHAPDAVASPRLVQQIHLVVR